MSATLTRPFFSFRPVLEQKLKGRVTVEERPASDIATLVTDAATLKEAALFLRDDPAAAVGPFLRPPAPGRRFPPFPPPPRRPPGGGGGAPPRGEKPPVPGQTPPCPPEGERTPGAP